MELMSFQVIYADDTVFFVNGKDLSIIEARLTADIILFSGSVLKTFKSMNENNAK